MEQETLTEALLHDSQGQLRWYWRTYHTCPCGAREESPASHPHVTGCPVAIALTPPEGDQAAGEEKKGSGE